MVENRESCCQQQYSPPEPLLRIYLAKQQRQTIASDLFYIGKINYLLVVDYYSRYIEATRLGISLSSKEIIQALKTVFA